MAAGHEAVTREAAGQETAQHWAAQGWPRPRDALGQLLTELHLLGGSASRADLTARVGCGRSVMSYLLGELTSRGVVSIDRERGHPPGGRERGGRETGRPSHRISVASSAPAVIGVHLSTGTAAVATVALGGRVVRRDEVPLSRPPQVGQFLDDLCLLADRHAGDHARLLGIGVAVPSPVRRWDGLAFAPLHLGWPSVPLTGMLEERMRRSQRLAALPLRLGNDANLAALAEHRHGAGREAVQLLYLCTADVGLGGALVSEGRLFDGAHGYAIEPGHITVDPAGAPCPCGSTGCLEVEADHRGLLRAAGRDPVPADGTAAAAARLLDAAEAGDPQLLRAVGQVAARLGSGLASLVNLTDPDRVVLSGSLARYHRLAPAALAGNLATRSFLSHADPGTIVPGALADAPLLGAAELAFQPLLDDPRGTLDAITEP